MRKTNEGRSPVGALLPAAAVGLALAVLLMLLGAVLVQRGVIAEGAITPCAFVFFAVGCAAAGFLAVRRAQGGGFVWAVSAGALVFLVLLAVGAMALHQPINLLRTALSLLCALAASALGGFAGAGTRKKKRYHHLKR